MKIEEQVTSLEPSNKLKELGVEQESLWYWNRQTKYLYHKDLEKSAWLTWNETSFISAFTVAELGLLLPDGLHYSWQSFNVMGKWGCEVRNMGAIPYERVHMVTEERTEANARAKMLIHLIENKLI